MSCQTSRVRAAYSGLAFSSAYRSNTLRSIRTAHIGPACGNAPTVRPIGLVVWSLPGLGDNPKLTSTFRSHHEYPRSSTTRPPIVACVLDRNLRLMLYACGPRGSVKTFTANGPDSDPSNRISE